VRLPLETAGMPTLIVSECRPWCVGDRDRRRRRLSRSRTPSRWSARTCGDRVGADRQVAHRLVAAHWPGHYARETCRENSTLPTGHWSRVLSGHCGRQGHWGTGAPWSGGDHDVLVSPRRAGGWRLWCSWRRPTASGTRTAPGPASVAFWHWTTNSRCGRRHVGRAHDQRTGMLQRPADGEVTR